VFGDDLISQTKAALTSVYHYDGLGSTRLLSNLSGAVTDRYTYTAFGESDTAGTSGNNSGSTDNNYLYTGEQRDPNLGFYYLRARYMDPGAGRFVSQDSWMGNSSDPLSLHKYGYANFNPVMGVDPSGMFTLTQMMTATNIQSVLTTTAVSYGTNIAQDIALQYIIFGDVTSGFIRDSLLDVTNFMPAGVKKGANLAKGVGSFIKYIRQFIRSPGFKNSPGNHFISIQGPSAPKADRTSFEFKTRVFKYKKFRFEFLVGGKKPGRVFQVQYKIGTNGNNGKGLFNFRLDYMDFTKHPPFFNPHFHCTFAGVSINHGIP